MRKRLKLTYYQRQVESLKNDNPRDWWKAINNLVGKSKCSQDLQCLANSISGGSLPSLAEEIATAFQSVSSHIPHLGVPQEGTRITDILEDHFIISREQTSKQLARIKTSKSPGPDIIPNWLLKESHDSLSGPVCALWNASFREGKVPDKWKVADTVPIIKVKPPLSVHTDLRPIALTPTLSKGLEFHARNWTNEKLLPVLDPHQFGSRQGFSTIMALAELVHSWLLNLEKKNTVVRVLFVDFRKAFDLIDHNIIMHKLEALNLPSFLIQWYSSFLSERKSKIKIEAVKSSERSIHAGVPQGTLLGPTTFLLHINCLQTQCPATKFVDDTTIWEHCHISGIDSKLQAATEQLTDWCKSNNMTLNTTKTKEMAIYFGRKALAIPRITVNGSEVELVDTFKLLGLVINNRLTWEDHVQYVTKKTAKRLHYLRVFPKQTSLRYTQLL